MVASKMKFDSDKKIKLNVGGEEYMTSVGTLTKTKGSALAALFSGERKFFMLTKPKSYMSHWNIGLV